MRLCMLFILCSLEAVWRTSMIKKCFFAFALVLSGCKYSEKDDGGAGKPQTVLRY